MKVLNEKLVKQSLNNAGLFLLFWELLKSTITDNLEDFYSAWFSEWKTTYSNELKDVRKLDKKIFNAYCLWHLQSNIIDTDDLALIETLTLRRNDIAHRLADIVLDENEDIDPVDVKRIVKLIHKIDHWWLVNVEIPTDPMLYEWKYDIDELDLTWALTWRIIVADYLVKLHLIENEDNLKKDD